MVLVESLAVFAGADKDKFFAWAVAVEALLKTKTANK